MLFLSNKTCLLVGKKGKVSLNQNFLKNKFIICMRRGGPSLTHSAGTTPAIHPGSCTSTPEK